MVLVSRDAGARTCSMGPRLMPPCLFSALPVYLAAKTPRGAA